ncbi:MAG: aldo/keto reductase [Oscillospiraceae bacterium]|jgi:diketogulonate reductase-like aldo/keto reductase|nr:aldo/keto reductase [Oscillospiraceae bacterium]
MFHLHTGEAIPTIGLGTFGSDKYGPNEVAEAVYGAIRSGYRLIDCASVYGNEDKVGAAIERAVKDGAVRRDELFINSKVWNDMHGRGDPMLSLAKTLKDLRMDYVDCFFVHWPFPNYHAPGCDGDSRNPDSVPFKAERFLATWREMERLYRLGLTRYLGMSNMTIPKLEAVLPCCEVKPALIEMEMHPSFQQKELFDYCIARGIQPIGYSPIGSPSRPNRDRAPEDVVDCEMPELVSIAKVHNVHPALVCLKWQVGRGSIPIPFSVKPEQYAANLRAATTDPLTEDEMRIMSTLDCGCRLIKGQVFLWPGAKGWEDLWDLDGEIRL